MKKLITTLFIAAYLLLIIKISPAQVPIDTLVDLDMLAVPNSPAFQLLGVNPSEVQKPVTPADFAFSIANATNDFSKLPSNYAVEFLPLSFFPKHQTYKKFTNHPDSTEIISWKEKLRNNIAQSFTISSGFSSDENIDISIPGYIKTRNGTGFKISLARGDLDTAFSDYKDSIISIRTSLNSLHQELDNRWDIFKSGDENYLRFDKTRNDLVQQILKINVDTALDSSRKRTMQDSLQHQLSLLNNAKELYEDGIKNKWQAESNTELAQRAKVLKDKIENLKYKRIGWMLDLAGGFVLGFRNNDFQNSIVEQYAFWLNGGYAAKKNFSVMALARYTSAVNAGIADDGSKKDENILDLGTKIEILTSNDVFSVSAEFVGRIYSDTTLTKFSFSAAYQVGKNQSLTFTAGKAFGSKTEFGGNLVAALNYVKAFGSKRKLSH